MNASSRPIATFEFEFRPFPQVVNPKVKSPSEGWSEKGGKKKGGGAWSTSKESRGRGLTLAEFKKGVRPSVAPCLRPV